MSALINVKIEIKFHYVWSAAPVRKVCQKCQYLHHTPCAAETVLHRFDIPRMIFWICLCGMAFHYATKAFSRSCIVWMTTLLVLIRLFSKSHRCSFGLRSGERLGHGITLMLLPCNRCLVMRAVWGGAVSCWTWNPGRAAKKGRTTGLTMLLQ